jgi:hypothetical protein
MPVAMMTRVMPAMMEMAAVAAVPVVALMGRVAAEAVVVPVAQMMKAMPVIVKMTLVAVEPMAHVAAGAVVPTEAVKRMPVIPETALEAMAAAAAAGKGKMTPGMQAMPDKVAPVAMAVDEVAVVAGADKMAAMNHHPATQ